MFIIEFLKLINKKQMRVINPSKTHFITIITNLFVSNVLSSSDSLDKS